MAKLDFIVHFWGVRGSVPVSGPDTARYGGNTSCVEMRCGKHVLIFDAGTGIKSAGLKLDRAGGVEANMFFSHCHWDHIIGFPFFLPFFRPKNKVTVWAGHLEGTMTTHDMIAGIMRHPYFPAGPEVLVAKTSFREFKPSDVLRLNNDVAIATIKLNHPGGAVGYRVDYHDKAVAYLTDTEHVADAPDPELVAFIRDADLVIYDATYTDEELPRFRGYGHSTWQHGVRLCEASGAKRLAIFHHSPLRSDAELDTIEEAAQLIFPGAFVARDDLTITL
jgi:phosphoribosyl 1,2-cyclic phosphodiesterase